MINDIELIIIFIKFKEIENFVVKVVNKNNWKTI
jgi:hypothetical protein